MKKIYSFIACVLLFSCQIEELNNTDQNLDGIFSKGSENTEQPSCTSSVETLSSELPETVNFCSEGQGPEAYLNIVIDGGILSGSYGAWCIDDDLGISATDCYENADVFLSTGTLPSGAFEYPDNFDLINWLLNQDLVGSESPGNGGVYTYGDLQFAIWSLLDDLRDPSGACNDCSLDPEWSLEKANELVAAARENGDGFIPGCNEFVGIILRPEGIQPLIIPYKILGEECFPCDGKVTELTLKYNGDQTDAQIVVTQKKDGEVVFDGVIQPGEEFSFVGIDKNNTLGTEITVTINGEVNTKIHTSCSQPIGPGLTFGDFLVVAGASRNGGALCPLDPPPGNGDDCGECEGKVTRLDLVNDGPGAQIWVTDKKGENEIFNAYVESGETFTLNGFDKKGTLGTEIVITANGSETKIHTSCSQPIGPGLSFGDFSIMGGASREGGELCPLTPPPGNGDDCGECDGKVTRLDLVNDGPASQIIVTDKKGENEIFNAFVETGDLFTLTGFDKNGTLGTEITIVSDGGETKIHTSCSQPIGPGLSFGDYTVVGGASRNGGELCPLDPSPGDDDDDDDDEDDDCECDGKVDYLKFRYNGDMDDDIRVETKKEGDVFDGKVSADGTFEIFGNDKKGTLGTEISIYVNGQKVADIHTSCSQPIGPGLVIGDFEIIEGTSRNGGALCPL